MVGPQRRHKPASSSLFGRAWETASEIGIFSLDLAALQNILAPHTDQSLREVENSLESMFHFSISENPIPWLNLNRLSSHPWFLLDNTGFSCTGITTALQASLRQPRNQPYTPYFQLYRLHFGNPEISLIGFHFHHFYLIIA